jgi:hypothetical protein
MRESDLRGCEGSLEATEVELRRWLASLEDDEVDVLEKRRDGGDCTEVVREYDRVLAAHKRGYAASSSPPPSSTSSFPAPPSSSSSFYAAHVRTANTATTTTATNHGSTVPVPVLPTPSVATVPVPWATPTFYLNSRNLNTNSELHRSRAASSGSVMTINFSDSVKDKDRDGETSSRCNSSDEQSMESMASIVPSSLLLPSFPLAAPNNFSDPDEEYFCPTATDVVQFILADD